MVWNPKSLPAAAAIFLSGCVAIAFTTIDIQRTLRSNDQPMTPEQEKVIEEMLDHHKARDAGEAPCMYLYVRFACYVRPLTSAMGWDSLNSQLWCCLRQMRPFED